MNMKLKDIENTCIFIVNREQSTGDILLKWSGLTNWIELN